MTEALASTARIATERPSSFLKELCEHFAHESRRHFGQEIAMSFGDARGSDEAGLECVQRIVSETVERLGQRDGLTVTWAPGSEGPSTG